MEDVLSRARRTTKLGQLGEILAAEALEHHSFQDVCNLNEKRNNQPFADLMATKDGKNYFIGVKARNEKRDIGMLNESYNCVLVRDAVNKRLKISGLTTDQITQLAIEQVAKLANKFDAIPAWITVAVRSHQGTYAAYFGLLESLGNRRSIPMTVHARGNYVCLVDWTHDRRITSDLTNRRAI
jgi:hypothetical protein